MPTRSGGRYELRDGKSVLIERTGYKPEAEMPKTTTAPKRAQKQEKRDADA